jgi:putative membrane protein
MPTRGTRVDDQRRDEQDDDVLAQRPAEADPQRVPLGGAQMLTVGAVGFGMGTADLVPAFSGGTVALLAGVYERLVANVRQGARALALLLRGRLVAGGRAIAAIEWRFVLPLLAGIASRSSPSPRSSAGCSRPTRGSCRRPSSAS